MVAQRDCGVETCRSRHIYSISFWGSSRVLGISMKEDKFFTPGGVEVFEGGGWVIACEGGVEGTQGAGGGDGNGDANGVEGGGTGVTFSFFLRL